MSESPFPLPLEDRFQEIDATIRGGRLKQARKALLECLREPHSTQLSGAVRAQLAGFLRRAGMATRSVRLLHPVVRPEVNLDRSAASALETAEYSAALIEIGMISEALDLLKGVDRKACPQALLFESFARFTRWEYREAIPCLKSFIRSPGISEYEQLIGQVNLADALVYVEAEEAVEVLAEAIESARRHSAHLLLGNLHQMQARHYLGGRQFARATQALDRAAVLLGEVEGTDDLFARKWRAILLLKSQRRSQEGLSALSRVRREASAKGHWETLRDCDLHQALETGDETLLRRVYYGTPFFAYRNAIREKVGAQLSMGHEHVVIVGSLNSRAPIALDAVTGSFTPGGSNRRLKPGGIQHCLLLALVSDLYRPSSRAELYSAISPGAHWNPHSSPLIVHQALHRLRHSLRRMRVPLQVRESQGRYGLASDSMITIRLAEASSPQPRLAGYLALLGQHPARGPFSASQAAEWLSISTRSANRVLSQAVSESRVAQVRQGRNIRYRVMTALPR